MYVSQVHSQYKCDQSVPLLHPHTPVRQRAVFLIKFLAVIGVMQIDQQPRLQPHSSKAKGVVLACGPDPIFVFATRNHRRSGPPRRTEADGGDIGLQARGAMPWRAGNDTAAQHGNAVFNGNEFKGWNIDKDGFPIRGHLIGYARPVQLRLKVITRCYCWDRAKRK